MVTTYNCSLVSALKESVEHRFSVYEADDLYHIAAIVDPRFKLLWCDSEEEKEDMKKLLSDFAADTYQMPCSDGRIFVVRAGKKTQRPVLQSEEKQQYFHLWKTVSSRTTDVQVAASLKY